MSVTDRPRGCRYLSVLVLTACAMTADFARALVVTLHLPLDRRIVHWYVRVAFVPLPTFVMWHLPLAFAPPDVAISLARAEGAAVAFWVTAVAFGGTGPLVTQTVRRHVMTDFSGDPTTAAGDDDGEAAGAAMTNAPLAAEGCPSPTRFRAITAHV